MEAGGGRGCKRLRQNVTVTEFSSNIYHKALSSCLE
jgi:hypothetical protein